MKKIIFLFSFVYLNAHVCQQQIDNYVNFSQAAYKIAEASSAYTSSAAKALKLADFLNGAQRACEAKMIANQDFEYQSCLNENLNTVQANGKTILQNFCVFDINQITTDMENQCLLNYEACDQQCPSYASCMRKNVQTPAEIEASYNSCVAKYSAATSPASCTKQYNACIQDCNAIQVECQRSCAGTNCNTVYNNCANQITQNANVNYNNCIKQWGSAWESYCYNTYHVNQNSLNSEIALQCGNEKQGCEQSNQQNTCSSCANKKNACQDNNASCSSWKNNCIKLAQAEGTLFPPAKTCMYIKNNVGQDQLAMGSYCVEQVGNCGQVKEMCPETKETCLSRVKFLKNFLKYSGAITQCYLSAPYYAELLYDNIASFTSAFKNLVTQNNQWSTTINQADIPQIPVPQVMNTNTVYFTAQGELISQSTCENNFNNYCVKINYPTMTVPASDWQILKSNVVKIHTYLMQQIQSCVAQNEAGIEAGLIGVNLALVLGLILVMICGPCGAMLEAPGSGVAAVLGVMGWVPSGAFAAWATINFVKLFIGLGLMIGTMEIISNVATVIGEKLQDNFSSAALGSISSSDGG